MGDNKKNIETREITDELQESYLDYAMSVIVGRALPDVRDGLKPVHRRILWDMWDSGLAHTAKFRKSANVVGQVLARYHPHSPDAVYDSLVRMAQDFSLRYPLVQGQGNFGSVDGDAPAAYRYTEARLSRIADEVLLDIEKETVGWSPNYDTTRNEPNVLPAKLPNLLVNGSMGIAVGMATNIPPHNLSEVADAIIYVADHPSATVDDLLQFVRGPDFPTGGIIYGTKSIREAYAAGRGAITTRARAEVVERKDRQPARLGSSRSGGFDIVVTEIPYQVNKAELIKKIAALVQTKKLEGIRDLRDESDREGLRIVIELKSDVPPQKILNRLFKHTDLQKDFHLNMIALVGGIEPRRLSLRDLIVEYLEHRKKVVRLRAEFELKRAKERAHILAGLVKALKAIDKIIATIKRSKDREEARAKLMKHFTLTSVQATAILEMRLQTLAALEREKIENELKEKRAFITNTETLLASPKRIVGVVKDEVRELKKKYGDGRRTEVENHSLTEFKDEDLIPNEEVVITLSYGGYVKRLPPDTFRSQKRGGKGLIGSNVSEEDFLTHFVSAETHDNMLFFTNRGRVFQTKAYEIPRASRTAKGRAIHNFLELPANESITAIVAYSDTEAKRNGAKYLVMVTQEGVIKKTSLADFAHIRRTGIIAVNLKKNDALKWADLSSGSDGCLVTTRGGQSIRFKESRVRAMGRAAAGVCAIKLKKGDHVAGFDIIEKNKVSRDARLLVVMERGYAKQTYLKEFRVQNRGGSGVRAAQVTTKTGPIVSSSIVTDETDIFALSAKGQVIRTQLASVRKTGRSAQGVRIMNLSAGDRLAGVVIV